METPRLKACAGLDAGKIKKVRLIAKIRGFTDLEAESANCVSVHKPKGAESETVFVSFGDQASSRKESYELDYCYEKSEGNDTIFSREVKPLISGVFDGHNATVIAYGARGSGKTKVIEGSDKDPGLAVLAVAEMLSMAEEKSITISIYEIFQDHVYDLLDPKRPEVLVLENGQGKIQLKGLSQVPVKSMSEFQKLYLIGHNVRKPVQKTVLEPPRRSHKGLIVHVMSPSDALPLGKMNFVDMAGYEDTRRKSIDCLNLVESTRVNRSIYALQNVVYALISKESHVPYRESKLTRMLQDSLGGKSRILMLTCLNPFFCQDSMYMVSLASRSCQGINQIVSEATRRTKSSARQLLLSSHKNQLHGSVSTARKQTGNQMHLSTRKANDTAATASVMKGRKLFDEASHVTKSEKKLEKTSFSSDFVSTIKSSVQIEESSESNALVVKDSPSALEKESSVANGLVVKDSTSVVEKDASPLTTFNPHEHTILDKDSFLHCEENDGEVTPCTNCNLKGPNMDKENDNSIVNKDSSPPISSQLQKISSTITSDLKSLISSTPRPIEMPPKSDSISNVQACTDFLEPKTPDTSMTMNDVCGVADINSPWEIFSVQSSKVKNTLVQEYLRVLNTGDKEDLKKLKGIGEKRTTYILQLREESPQPFKNLDDLKDIGLSAKQIKEMMKKEVGGLFN